MSFGSGLTILSQTRIESWYFGMFKFEMEMGFDIKTSLVSLGVDS
jgi:hypothetical protein